MKRFLSKLFKPPVLTALIGLTAAIISGIFILQAAIKPKTLEIESTQTAEAIVATQTAEAKATETQIYIQNTPHGLANTPIPYGPPLLEMSFTKVGDGYCDDYDDNILGYEIHQYYIQPLSSRGYISACRSGDWGPQVSLEVEAYPDGDLSLFGYGVIIGWQGNSSGTTDACIFGVRRTVGAQTVSEVFVKQRIDGVERTLGKETLDFSLDNKPHRIRVVMLTDSLAVGYIDDQFVGDFEFDACIKGKIGLVAWGTGETKIYFDDLRLHSLP